MHEGGPLDLVSSTVRELVVSSGLEFIERGVETLRARPANGGLFTVDAPPV
ncbi:MAG TPA: hypothetical protein VF009_11115 [Solirubrobacterales bacterium]